VVQKDLERANRRWILSYVIVYSMKLSQNEAVSNITVVDKKKKKREIEAYSSI
jgi:hypothetical protein